VSALQNKVKNALDEVRMLILGLQVLLGFQFRAFFEKGYDQLSALDRGCELVGLFAFLVVLTILFLAPARHRQVEQGNDTARFHLFTMSVMRAALFPLAQRPPPVEVSFPPCANQIPRAAARAKDRSSSPSAIQSIPSGSSRDRLRPRDAS
jgi:hypothetical protein